MPVSSGIMFFMYKFGRLVALVYIRRTLAGDGGRTKTDQGFYGHGRTTRDPVQRATRQSEGRTKEAPQRGQENYKGRGPEGHRPDYYLASLRALATEVKRVLLRLLARLGVDH